MLSSLFVVSVSRVWVSSTLLFFGSAKPCTDHSAVTVITGPQEPVFFFHPKEKQDCLRGSQFVSVFLCLVLPSSPLVFGGSDGRRQRIYCGSGEFGSCAC